MISRMLKWIRDAASWGLMVILLATFQNFMYTKAWSENAASAEISITYQSRDYVYRGIYHYIRLDFAFSNADRLRMRVYDPEGNQKAFRTRLMVRENRKEMKSWTHSTARTDTELENVEVLFLSKSSLGVWRIEVEALQGDQVAAATEVTVEVRDPGGFSPEDYEYARSLVDLPEKGLKASEIPVQVGRIRFVAQMNNESCWRVGYWKNKAYDLSADSSTKCSRAVFSMALSWMGIDCTPVRMSEMVYNANIPYNYDDVLRKLGNVERRDGSLEELWAYFEAGEGSPISIHFEYGNEAIHDILLIARDSANPDLYYAVNPGSPMDLRKYGGTRHEHVFPILIEDGEIGGVMQSLWKSSYHKGKIDRIRQWYITP